MIYNQSEDLASNDSYVFQGMHRTTAELVMGTITFLVITVMTMVGNMLVILSVFTYRPLKKVQNYFIVSLASADFAVAVLVMPFHLVKFLMHGEWLFGLILCQMWLTFDILCCTASILNLTAIAIDRYWAIHNPIEYANKRTLNLVGGMITIVWSLSALISIPPLIGWNDWSDKSLEFTCELTSHKYFVIYSASGSFFIPLGVMTIVYIKIYIAARDRILKNRDRSGLGQMKLLKKTKKKKQKKESVSMGRKSIEGQPPELKIAAEASHNNLGQNQSNNTTGRLSVAGNGGTENSPLIKHKHLSTARNSASAGAIEVEVHSSTGDDKPDTQQTGLSNNNHQTRALVRNSAAGENLQAQENNKNSAARQASQAIKQREKISVSKEKKAAKTLAVIMGVFVLCWLPFFLMYVIMPFCENCLLHPKVAEAITWLGYINSAINPVIYTIFNLDFRRAFERLLCLKFRQWRGRR